MFKDFQKNSYLERVSAEKNDTAVFALHYSLYVFSSEYVDKKVVLDIGCGTGYGANFLSTKSSRVYGVDVSDEAISYAKSHYNGQNLSYAVMDAHGLKFEDEKFDVVCSFEVIEHLSDYRLYLAQIKRVLKKGGLFLLSTPNKKFSSPGVEKPTNPYHLHEFYFDELKKVLSEYFEFVQMLGQSIDKKKEDDLKNNRFKNFIASLDFLNLRKKLPSNLRKGVASGIGMVIEESMSYKDFPVTSENPEDAQTLVAVSRKG